MNKLPQISQAEYQVMKVIWASAPISTNEVTDRLLQTTAWNPKTVHTLLRRLVQKGALSYIKAGRVFIYTPLVKEGDYLKQENIHFLQRFYDGNASDMLISFIKSNLISREVVVEVGRLLQNAEKKKL